MSNLNKFLTVLIVVVAGLTGLHSHWVALIDDDWFWLSIFIVIVLGGRIGLYFYRTDRGRKDELFTRPWWTAL